MKTKLEWWRWIPFWVMIFGLLFYGLCYATPQIAPPDIPKMDVDPFKDPNVIQEKILVEYIMDGIEKYVDDLDWFNWDYKTEMNDRIIKITDILETYGYTEKDYYVSVKAMGDGVTKKIAYWVIEVSVTFKSNKDVMHIETFTVMEIE